MLFLKNIGRSFIYTLASFFILTILLTVLNYFNIFNSSIANIFKVINLIIAIFLGSFILGHRSMKKGWLEGLKYGLIFGVVLFLFNYLGLGKFNIFVYLIVLITSVIGGMLGISFKKN